MFVDKIRLKQIVSSMLHIVFLWVSVRVLHVHYWPAMDKGSISTQLTSLDLQQVIQEKQDYRHVRVGFRDGQEDQVICLCDA